MSRVKSESGRIGSSFDSFLRKEGIYEEVTARAIKSALAELLARQMDQDRISKAELARRMKTSRSQVDRLLDPTYEGVSLGTLWRAARALGRDLRVELA